MSPVQKLTVMLTLFWTSTLSIGWIVVLALPSGWAKKVTFIYSVDMGLYEAEVSEGSASKIYRMITLPGGQEVENQLKKIKYGKFAWHDFANFWCSLRLGALVGATDPCQNITMAMYSSWIMLGLGSIGVFSLMCGGFMLYVYTYMEAHRWMRSFARGAFAIALACFSLGTLQYLFLIEEVEALPPAGKGTAASVCAFAAAMMTVLVIVPLVVSIWMQPSEDELMNEAEEERKQLERDARLMGYYGSNENEKMEMGAQVPPGNLGQPAPAEAMLPGYGMAPPQPGMAPPMGPAPGGYGAAPSSGPVPPGYGQPAWGGQPPQPQMPQMSG